MPSVHRGHPLPIRAVDIIMQCMKKQRIENAFPNAIFRLESETCRGRYRGVWYLLIKLTGPYDFSSWLDSSVYTGASSLARPFKKPSSRMKL